MIQIIWLWKIVKLYMKLWRRRPEFNNITENMNADTKKDLNSQVIFGCTLHLVFYLGPPGWGLCVGGVVHLYQLTRYNNYL